VPGVVTAVRERLRAALGWLDGAEPAERARFVEAGLAILLGLRLALSPYRALSGLPASLYEPPPFLSWLDTIPSTGTITVLQVVGVAGAVAAVATRGPWRRAGFVVAWTCLLFLAGFRDSRGKIMHNDLLLLWACVPFLFAAADLAWRDRTPSRRAGWPVRLSLVFVALTYFFAGWAKLRRSGPAWVASDNVTWVLRWAAADRSGLSPWPELTRWVADQHVLTVGSAAVTLALELTFPVVLFVARLRPLYAAGAVALHVFTIVLLGFDYWLWIGVVLVVLIDWPALLERRRAEAPVTTAA
jgi:hypothetical protein